MEDLLACHVLIFSCICTKEKKFFPCSVLRSLCPDIALILGAVKSCLLFTFRMLGRLIVADQCRYSSGQLTLSSFPPRAPLRPLVDDVNITVQCYYYRYPLVHALSIDSEP